MTRPPEKNLLCTTVMWPWFLAVSATHIAVGVLVALVTRPFDRAGRAVLWVGHLFWGRLLFDLGPLWRMRREIPEITPGPYVIVSNHISALDIPANLGLPIPIRVCARRTLFEVPVMGRYMRVARHIVTATDSREEIEATLAACREAVDQGISLLIFAEGTRSDDGEIAPFKKGAFRLARDLGVPILPVLIDGTQLMPKGSFWLSARFGDMRMRVLPPVSSQGTETIRVLTRRVRDAMVAELAAMRGRPLAPPREIEKRMSA